MPGLFVAPEAEDDLFEIWQYLIDEAGVLIADRVESELIDAFQGLSRTPSKGHRRSDLTDARVLFYTLYHYLIVYRSGDVVEIVAVLHGKRDTKTILGNRL